MMKSRYDAVKLAYLAMVLGGCAMVPIVAAQAGDKSKPMNLISRIERLEASVFAINAIIGVPNGTAVPDDKPLPTPQNPKPSPVPGDTTKISIVIDTSDVPETVLKVLRNHCWQCHSGGAKNGGGFKLFQGDSDAKLGTLTALDLVRMDYMIYSGIHPPEGNVVPGEEYKVLRAWFHKYSSDVIASTSNKEAVSVKKR